MNRFTIIALVVITAALLTGSLYAFVEPGWVRVAITVPFLLIGPGLALICLLRIGDALAGGTLAVAASLGLETVVATTLLAGGWWSPGRALTVVIVITLAATVWSLSVKPGQRRGERDRNRSAEALKAAPPGRSV